MMRVSQNPPTSSSSTLRSRSACSLFMAMEEPPHEATAHDTNSEESSEESDYSVPPSPRESSAQATLNDAYAAEFDAHVTSSFNLHYSAGQTAGKGPSLRLHPSVNTVNAAFYLPRPRRPEVSDCRPLVEHSFIHSSTSTDLASHAEITPEIQTEIDSAKSLPGTLWSSKEKDTFFECLARFSIHRIDDFLPFLPYKSRVEVEAYYLLLKAGRDKLSRHKTVRTTLCERKVDGHLHKSRPWYTIKTCEEGLPYWRIPAAIEVDEDWVEFEEAQSHLLADIESKRLGLMSENNTLAMQLYTTKGPEEGINVINPDTAAELSKIYNANNITPALYNQESGQLAFSSLVFLDELVKLRVRDMMLAIMVKKGETETNFAENDTQNDTQDDASTVSDAEELEYENLVTKEDVWRATDSLRLFETARAGFNSKFNDGKTPILSTYWQDLVSSLKLSVEDTSTDMSEGNEVFDFVGSGYREQDFFLRDTNPPGDTIEIPEILAEDTAMGAYEGESDAENYSSDSEDATPGSLDGWDLPVPWDISDSESEKSEAAHANSVVSRSSPVMDQSDVETARINIDPPGNAALNSFGDQTSIIQHPAPRMLLFSELEKSETFSRKRVLEDILIEDNLEQDVSLYVETMDQRMAWRQLQALRSSAGMPSAEGQQPKLRKKTTMYQSTAHKAWAKHYASY